jgi:hypothetical protein
VWIRSYAQTMTTKKSAGARLRTNLGEALQAASQEAGRELEFDEAERHLVDQAAAASDRPKR